MPKIPEKDTPQFIKSASNSIAWGLKILANAILKHSTDPYPMYRANWAKYVRLLSDKIAGKVVQVDKLELQNSYGV